MKVKVEFCIIEDVEKQIKDWGLSEDQIKVCRDKKEEIFKDYTKRLEEIIRNEIECEDYTIIKDFKIEEVVDEN